MSSNDTTERPTVRLAFRDVLLVDDKGEVCVHGANRG